MAEVPALHAGAAQARNAQRLVAAPDVPDGADEAPDLIPATTAFLVLWIGGEVIVSTDLDAPVIVDHQPTPDEILGAAAVLVADRTAERTANLSAQVTVATVENRQQRALANLQQAQAEAALAAEQRGRRG